MLLRRLAHPTRLADLQMQFGWEKSRFSRITYQTAHFLWHRWKHLLRFDPTRLTREKLSSFAAAFKAKGAPLDCIAALIDGTLQKSARPIHNQRLIYNGWKRIHCLKYHAVISPDGMVIHVYGPVEGRRHDETVYKESRLEDILDKHFWTPDDSPLFVYGDPAYNVSAHIMAPFKGPVLTQEEHAFNSAMSKIREPVEWFFKEITQQFTYLDYSREQKLFLTPCGLFYLVSVLLCNAHTILHPPQISQYFNCQPPTLEEYFTGGPVVDEELEAWCLHLVDEEIRRNEENMEE
ncbi:hypothetical protein M422DRAFT_195025 [Sphaerobolus stellatus SS14]|uniref:DDE Tnp4 domain-containing protein n=1 Tax=Sphaerobolus stellatus (strain SS14) TaxID=990650 RepID=A0A0C9UFA4_SPHS4|nr:hypothetical protein M422DRAFT_195025 [Sphaerobolus stellatus SS14]